ncbi:MAG: L,D-transpeptidase family protein [Anaerolineales bacterium]|nr:L,D-transpeptidase family protein [Anaerolineales bacterium]
MLALLNHLSLIPSPMWWLSIPSNRTRLFRAVSLSMLIVSIGFMALIATVYFGLRLFHIILPGVYVAEQDLTFTTVNDAVSLLEASSDRDYYVVLFAPDWSLVRAPSDLGLRIDAETTAQNAFEAGYANGFWAGATRILGLAEPRLLPPVVTFDEDLARLGLQALSLEAHIVPQEAHFALENGQLIAEPGIYGRTLDVDATFQTLAADPTVTMLSGYLPASLMGVVPAIAEIPPDVLAQAQTYLTNSITFKAYDPIADTYTDWTVPPETLAATIRLQIQEGRVALATDAFPLRDEINKFNESLGPDHWLDLTGVDDKVNAALEGEAPAIFTMEYAPTNYTVQAGDTLLVIAWRQRIPLWRIVQANPGLDPENLIVGATLLIPSRTDLLELPIVYGKRIVVSLTQQHLWAYENGQLIMSEVISTGIDRSPTQPGVFQVRSHVENAYASVWDLYMPNFVGIYEAWPGFENGFHGLPLLSGGRVLWRGTLGSPVSFGCIILDTAASQQLYNWAEDGVIVEIDE